MKRNRGFRWAEVMRYLQGNPRTIKEVAKYMDVKYQMVRKYLYELLTEGKVEIVEEETKPVRYRRRK
jgi:predicted ArsR family transcriptional regulator